MSSKTALLGDTITNANENNETTDTTMIDKTNITTNNTQKPTKHKPRAATPNNKTTTQPISITQTGGAKVIHKLRTEMKNLKQLTENKTRQIEKLRDNKKKANNIIKELKAKNNKKKNELEKKETEINNYKIEIENEQNRELATRVELGKVQKLYEETKETLEQQKTELKAIKTDNVPKAYVDKLEERKDTLQARVDILGTILLVAKPLMVSIITQIAILYKDVSMTNEIYTSIENIMNYMIKKNMIKINSNGSIAIGNDIMSQNKDSEEKDDSKHVNPIQQLIIDGGAVILKPLNIELIPGVHPRLFDTYPTRDNTTSIYVYEPDQNTMNLLKIVNLEGSDNDNIIMAGLWKECRPLKRFPTGIKRGSFALWNIYGGINATTNYLPNGANRTTAVSGGDLGRIFEITSAIKFGLWFNTHYFVNCIVEGEGRVLLADLNINFLSTGNNKKQLLLIYMITPTSATLYSQKSKDSILINKSLDMYKIFLCSTIPAKMSITSGLKNKDGKREICMIISTFNPNMVNMIQIPNHKRTEFMDPYEPNKQMAKVLENKKDKKPMDSMNHKLDLLG